MEILIKTVLEGIAVSFVVYILNPKRPINEILMMGAVAAVTLIVVDNFTSGLSGSVRQGSGFRFGQSMVGGNDNWCERKCTPGAGRNPICTASGEAMNRKCQLNCSVSRALPGTNVQAKCTAK